MLSKSRILIFTGGHLGKWALEEVGEGDLLVGVDRGTWFLLDNGLQPHYAVGDFDSVTAQEFEAIRRQCAALSACDPVLKDYTDTELAFNWALEQRPGEIILLGALGTRFDHSLANVHLLLKGLKTGVPCRIIDEKNEIILIDQFTTVSRGRFKYISLLPFTPEVTGITLEGFQYPLHRAVLTAGQSLGISNGLIAEVGKIFVDAGQLLVIKSMD